MCVPCIVVGWKHVAFVHERCLFVCLSLLTKNKIVFIYNQFTHWKNEGEYSVFMEAKFMQIETVSKCNFYRLKLPNTSSINFQTFILQTYLILPLEEVIQT